MIQLIAREYEGEAICPAATIEGRHIPERRYPIANRIVTLDNQPKPVLKHDAQFLCRIPEGMYRTMTPLEQNNLHKSLERGGRIEE